MTRLRRFAASARQARLRRFAASAGQGRGARAAIAALALLAAQDSARAHSGPPFPIVTDVVRPPYTISIWTDPDATDDGSPGGQFWVVLALTPKEARIPPDTRVTVSARRITQAPGINGGQSTRRAITRVAAPVRGDLGNQFAALVLSREGLYDVQVDIDGPLGRAVIDSRIEVTYDARPPAYMLVWYLVPFLLAGFLWSRLLLHRRHLFHKR